MRIKIKLVIGETEKYWQGHSFSSSKKQFRKKTFLKFRRSCFASKFRCSYEKKTLEQFGITYFTWINFQINSYLSLSKIFI